MHILSLWSPVSIGMEKRVGDKSDGTYLSAVKLKHRLCMWSDLSFTMVNNLVRCSELSDQLDQQ